MARAFASFEWARGVAILVVFALNGDIIVEARRADYDACGWGDLLRSCAERGRKAWKYQ